MDIYYAIFSLGFTLFKYKASKKINTSPIKNQSLLATDMDISRVLILPLSQIIEGY